MNNKGFTLVELLVVIVVMGVIMGMSWPVITKIQENNEINKYEKYGEAMVEGAKLYVDSYEEDLFYYEDDLTDEQKKVGQCAYITYNDLIDHLLIKDFNMNGITCNSESSFVRVVRRNGKYTYSYYLGCGYKKSDNSQLKNDSSDIFYTYPNVNSKNYMNHAACNKLHSDGDAPVMRNLSHTTYPYVSSGRPYTYITGYVEDNDTDNEEITYCFSESATDCSPYRNASESGYISKTYYFDGFTLDGSTHVVYVHLKDLNGNHNAIPVTITLYKLCSRVNKYYISRGSCSKTCGGGTRTVTYQGYDWYNNSICGDPVTEQEPCNEWGCCQYVIRQCDSFSPLNNDNLGDFDKPICNGACGNPIESKLVKAKCNSVSADDPSIVCETNKNIVTLQACPGDTKACLDIYPPWVEIYNADVWCNSRNKGQPEYCVARRYPDYLKVKLNKNVYTQDDLYQEKDYVIYTQFIDAETGDVLCQGEWNDCSAFRLIGDERKDTIFLYYARFEDGKRSPVVYTEIIGPEGSADASMVDY